MPKQLQISLLNLLQDNTMSGWSIHGSSNGTTIVLRFKMEDCVLGSNASVKYKRASHSQTVRDNQRACQRSAVVKATEAVQHDIEAISDNWTDKSKSRNTDQSTMKPQQCASICCPKTSSRITKSNKAKPKSQIQVKPSAVPVHGHSEQLLPRSTGTPRVNDHTQSWADSINQTIPCILKELKSMTSPIVDDDDDDDPE